MVISISWPAWFTGAPWVVVVLGALSVTCQTWTTVFLLRRWCPTLLGAGGTESFRSPRTLLYTCIAAVVGSAVGAAVGALGVYASGVSGDRWVPQIWFGRHLTGILVVGCIGHLAWEWRTRRVPARLGGGGRRELVALWTISVVVVGVIFVQPLPLVFLVISLCVWSAVRFSTFQTALHALTVGGGSLVFTYVGLGPAAMLDDAAERALVGQVFLVAVLLTGLAVGTLSDRIDELMMRMRESRARTAEQAELLAEMTESMDEGLIVLDGQGLVDRSNGASRRLAHRVSPHAPDDAALADLVELVLNPTSDHTEAMRAELGVGDVQVPVSSGEDMVISVSRTELASAQGGDDRPGVLLVLREVTEHRKGLRPLVSFAATAAHDLRGPLTAVRAWLDVAAADLDVDSDTLASIRRAEGAADQMADLINDLLAQAVAEAGDLDLDEVDLGGPDGPLDRARALLRPDDEIDAPEEGLISAYADEVALRQLFANLVGNAVKYARPGVPARITVRAQREGARVVVEVEDNGVGVSEHQRDLIFERFHRGIATGDERRGTGMGLAICRTIVQRHGGTIVCLPAEPGPGSVFRFDLPAAALERVGGLPVPSAPLPAEADEQLAPA